MEQSTTVFRTHAYSCSSLKEHKPMFSSRKVCRCDYNSYAGFVLWSAHTFSYIRPSDSLLSLLFHMQRSPATAPLSRTAAFPTPICPLRTHRRSTTRSLLAARWATRQAAEQWWPHASRTTPRTARGAGRPGAAHVRRVYEYESRIELMSYALF